MVGGGGGRGGKGREKEGRRMKRWGFWAEGKKRAWLVLEPPAKRSEISSIFFFFYFSSNRSIKKQRSILVRLFLFVQRRSFLALACGSPPPGSRGSNYSLLVSSAQLSWRSRRNSSDWSGSFSRILPAGNFIRQFLFCNLFCNNYCSITVCRISPWVMLRCGWWPPSP